jgi:hypothetical protein
MISDDEELMLDWIGALLVWKVELEDFRIREDILDVGFIARSCVGLTSLWSLMPQIRKEKLLDSKQGVFLGLCVMESFLIR